ncbi:hypothetical protein [Asanoa siamensis]|uniref:SUKH-4 immunity protein of toxin-antitoxin system n=1 Tax=Asanoa siamensis TaxID=926357 RepID=A0ABQ4CMN8_9ACTN|nr:hypothetical protein [Asanoa siamensis]GIF72558.1 hypothetical protein Asi02nite_20760 [Asanoa siamensis]
MEEESLTERLDDLEWWLRVLRRPVVDLLVPGLPADAIGRYGPLPPVVGEWFAWHDGVTRDPGQDREDVEVIPGYAPLALAEAVGLRHAYEDDPVLTLGDGWLPLLASEDGDLYAALWSGPNEPRVVAIRAGEPTRIEFPDLPAMVELFVECYRSGGFTVSGDGRLSADQARYDELYDAFTRGR